MQELIFHDFATVRLEDMKKVKLMNRIDTKFVTTEPVLEELLHLAVGEYMAQEIDGKIILPYSTRYFDTEDCEMYHQHLHGKMPRKKIRVREYVTSGMKFLEIKRKNNKGRTDKKRIPAQNLAEDDRADFILDKADYDADSLIPQIENRFNRITLVNKDMTERLTIDIGLRFHNTVTSIDCDLSGLAIIELKRDGRATSPISEILRQLRIQPSGFSKYCIGMALTNPNVKTNRFKPRLHRFKKMLASACDN